VEVLERQHVAIDIGEALQRLLRGWRFGLGAQPLDLHGGGGGRGPQLSRRVATVRYALE